MNVSSLPELLTLHGYGVYVWPAYAAMLGALLLEPWLIRRRLARARRARQDLSPSTQPGADGASPWGATRSPEEQR